MADLVSLSAANWDDPFTASVQDHAIHAIESGSVLMFPQLHFPLQGGEAQLLSPATSRQKKNVSFDPSRGTLRGSIDDEAKILLLRGMMKRFAAASRGLLDNLLPRYQPYLLQARTSFRPVEIEGRPSSWRKDDTRLHVDSFPSSPTQGRRILRVFTNINPDGRNRTWRLGESFPVVAGRYLPTIPGPLFGASRVLDILGITKGRRSAYDHFMLRLHDRMKADFEYQRESAQRLQEFPPGSTWIVYTDQVSHAATMGQHALEQTFHLPVSCMLDPSQAPLRVLERIIGRELA